MKNSGRSRQFHFMLIATAFISMNAIAATHIQINKSEPVTEIVVQFKKSANHFQANSVALTALENHLGENSISSMRVVPTDSSMSVIRFTDAASVSKAIAELKKQDNVEIAEPNYHYYALDNGVPNDSDFKKLWGMKNGGGWFSKKNADINVLPVWNKGITGDRSILVAVIDTGVDRNHPDLKDNIFTNKKEIPGNGIDDDKNGFIDDVNGWNFYANNNNSMDDHGHGSHCSGTIGALGNNSIGVAGVNWQVSILPIKFLSAQGQGEIDGAVAAINYATMMGANVMSNSWGGDETSELLKKSVENARDHGIIFVAAAGNDSSDNDSKATYPAALGVENIITVAATDKNDKMASFSNYGAKSVHVAAPGVGIYSTVKNGGYGSMSGTSMACPHVAGISALMLAADRTLTFSQVKERLISSSDKLDSLKGKVVSGGRVNVERAILGKSSR